MRSRLSVLIFVGSHVVMAQSSKQFDLATVKPYAIHDGNFMMRRMPGGSFRAVGVTLKMLIMNAYNVKAFQIVNAPDWIGVDLWEIEAKAEGVEGPLSRDESQAMLRKLLESRYQLKMHQEMRNLPVYALVAAKDRSGKLVPPTGDQAGICPCSPGLLAPSRASMKLLADELSRQLWRVVIDKTAITGEYSFRLEWTPAPDEYGPEALGLPPRTAGEPPPNIAFNGPSIFTALKDQLGLRLLSQKGKVTILVIDHAERPDPN
jgi:uncharacterized protein (TIGR03435 family)